MIAVWRKRQRRRENRRRVGRRPALLSFPWLRWWTLENLGVSSSVIAAARPPSHCRPTSRPRTSPLWNVSSVVLPLLLLLILVAIVQASTRRCSTGGIRRAALASPPLRSTTAAAAGEAHAEDLHRRRRRRCLDRRRRRRRQPPPLPPGRRRPRRSKCRWCRRPHRRLIVNLVVVMRNGRRIVSATFRTSNV